MKLINAIQFAKKMTERAANVKDWRLSKKDKEMREMARQLAEGKGYIIATDAEMMGKYNLKHTSERDSLKHVWCFYPSIANANGKVNITVVCVR